MSQDLIDRLSKEIEVADWSMLEPHYKRDALFMVSGELELVQVASMVAQSRIDMIDFWIKDGLIVRPTEKEQKVYEETKFKKLANFMIVQPFVFAQLIKIK